MKIQKELDLLIFEHLLFEGTEISSVENGLKLWLAMGEQITLDETVLIITKYSHLIILN
jgi:hypothetical protein